MMYWLNLSFSLISLILISFLVLRDIKENKYNVIFNPFFWAAIYLSFYFLLPSFFVYEINYYFKWGISENSILFSSLLLFCFTAIIFFAYLFCPSSFRAHSKNVELKNSVLILILFILISVYLVYVFYVTLSGYNFQKLFFYDGEQRDVYKIKNLAYLLIPVLIFTFVNYRKFYVFIPSLLIIIIDLLNGSRTTAFIALVPIFLCICFQRKTLFILPGGVLLCLLLILGVIRSDNIIGGVPWYLNAIGEFRETYITLPLFIEDSDYIGKGGLFHLLGAVGSGVLYGFREDISQQYIFAGQNIAALVNRGYGLGSNIIIESAYYGYFYMISTLLFIPLILYFLKKIIENTTVPVALSLSAVTVIFLRLLFREGAYLSLGTLLLVFSFYLTPVFLLSRIGLLKR